MNGLSSTIVEDTIESISITTADPPSISAMDIDDEHNILVEKQSHDNTITVEHIKLQIREFGSELKALSGS